MDQLQNAKYLLAVVFFVALIFFKLMYLSITYFPEWSVSFYYLFRYYYSECHFKMFVDDSKFVSLYTVKS